MKSLTDQFADWVNTKPADEAYDYLNPNACAFYQFAVAFGIPNPVRDGSDIPPRIEDALNDVPMTFGALADRLAR